MPNAQRCQVKYGRPSETQTKGRTEKSRELREGRGKKRQHGKSTLWQRQQHSAPVSMADESEEAENAEEHDINQNRGQHCLF